MQEDSKYVNLLVWSSLMRTFHFKTEKENSNARVTNEHVLNIKVKYFPIVVLHYYP